MTAVLACDSNHGDSTPTACCREIIVKLARFLTSLGREILQIPLGTHQLQQEPGLAESVVAILRESTSVELVNVATSVAGSMSARYAACGLSFVHQLLTDRFVRSLSSGFSGSQLVSAFISAHERQTVIEDSLHAKISNLELELASSNELIDSQVESATLHFACSCNIFHSLPPE